MSQIQDIQAVLTKAEQQCKANGVRLTKKRKMLLNGLVQANKAISAYELIDFCEEKFGESMPAMSVYRILDFLQQENLVHKLNLANKYVACSHIMCDHNHRVSQFLICAECESVKEIMINADTMEQLRKDVEGAGFQLNNSHFEIKGICQNCSQETVQ